MEIILVLYNIRSLHNVGSIFRTADAAGVRKIYLCGITPRPIDRLGKVRSQFGKVSLGAEGSVSWVYKKMATVLLKNLQSEGYKIFAVEQSKKSVPYYKLRTKKVKSKIALVLGNEVNGLPGRILSLADKILEIPMRRSFLRDAAHPRRRRCGKESLNVSVAAGIVLFGIIYAKK